MSAIIHQQEVCVVVVEAAQPALTLDIGFIVGWKTTLK